MKTILKISFLCFAFIQISLAQWYEQNSGTTQNLYSLQFVDLNTGWAVGDSGTIIHTADGGLTWNYQFCGEITDKLNSIFFTTPNIGWIAGNKFNLLKTTDMGQTWLKLDSSNLDYANYYSIFFTDVNHGWIGGHWGIFKYTTNGGENWQFSPDNDVFHLSIFFIDSLNGWAVGHRLSYFYWEERGIILHTHDGGIGWWTTQLSGIDGWQRSVYFVDSLTGWSVGDNGTIFNTIDGGDNWTTQSSGVNSSLNGVHFINIDNGWIIGDSGVILTTSNSGENWVEVESPTNKNLHSVFFVDTNSGWIAGDHGIILRYGKPNTSTPEVWTRDLIISDKNSQNILLTFGQSTQASNSIDNSLGESELPPPPPVGTFDARFSLEDNSSTILDLRNSEETEVNWTIQFQPSSEGYPITLGWDKDNLPFGSFFLRDVITGSIINIDMKLNDSLVVTNESINKLQIVYKEQFTSSITNNTNWDLISVPLAADNMEVSSIFPDALSSAFKFDGSYKSTDNLENGVGYWVKFADSNITNIYGDEVNNPNSVKKGWNIIGPYNKEISTDKILTTPTGILTSNIYGFENGYFITDTLTPGNGYWIKTNQDGEISFEESSPLDKKSSINKQNSEPVISFDIIAHDGVSDSIKLTFGLDSLATNGFDQFLGEEELPPLPPLGVFDVRIEIPDTLISSYSDYRPLAVDCYEHKISYQLGDSSDGLTLSWNLPEGVTLNISDLFGGSVFNETFESGEGSFSITNMNINDAQLTLCYSDIIVAQHDKEIIPVAFALSQNYPNPFNPTTRIQFGLPKESKVSIIIFNILGEKVTELVNQQLKAGYHEVEFNSSNYSSGIYFYRIQAYTSDHAADYVETRKMIFLK